MIHYKMKKKFGSEESPPYGQRREGDHCRPKWSFITLPWRPSLKANVGFLLKLPNCHIGLLLIL